MTDPTNREAAWVIVIVLLAMVGVLTWARHG
jgi:hypothetical protein